VDISSRVFADVAVVVAVGRIDHASAGDFERALMPLLDPSRGADAGLVLDFTRIGYISSVGLRVLMVAAKRMRERRARIAVAGLQPVVAEIFAISRFDSVLDVFASVRTALEAISPAALAAFDASALRPEP
jgi:anti-sigma B factor antagonist/stage II sporulation protein AA (anti-sigma F factor antagonist)